MRALNGQAPIGQDPSYEPSQSTVEREQAAHLVSLKKGHARDLSSTVDRMLPDTLQSLVLPDRTVLLEVACSEDSILTKTMQDLTGRQKSAQRLSIWNHYDLSTDNGVRSVLDRIDKEKPMHVWLSMECGPYSIMQNANQRNVQQKENLEAKRREVLKQYVGGAVIMNYCIQRGTHCTWEWSQSCQAWRLPLVQQLASRYALRFAIVRGCQVNLKDSQGHVISKGWKLMTTHELLSRRMNLPCTCGPDVTHVPCEGQLTKRTAFYTPWFAKRVCQTILQGNTRETLFGELEGKTLEGDQFGKETFCLCHETNLHGAQLQCGHCASGLAEALAAQEPEGPCQLEDETIKKKLYLLHAATGHSPLKYMVLALKRRGVHSRIIELAQKFTCAVCQEKARPQPRNLSSLEPQPPKFEVVSGDVGHFVHPISGEHVQFLMLVDEGSRFRVARVVGKGKKQHISAATFIATFKEAWSSYFGFPQTLRLDPDGAYRSHGLSEFCDQNHIYLDLIPGEGHWKLGICERSIQATKTLLAKVCADFEDQPLEEVLAECMRVLNNREIVRGYSPLQHVFGRAPDDTGRFFTKDTAVSPDLQWEHPHSEHQKSAEMKCDYQLKRRFWIGTMTRDFNELNIPNIEDA